MANAPDASHSIGLGSSTILLSELSLRRVLTGDILVSCSCLYCSHFRYCLYNLAACCCVVGATADTVGVELADHVV